MVYASGVHAKTYGFKVRGRRGGGVDASPTSHALLGAAEDDS